jgi:hypothetical protein
LTQKRHSAHIDGDDRVAVIPPAARPCADHARQIAVTFRTRKLTSIARAIVAKANLVQLARRRAGFLDPIEMGARDRLEK